MSLRSNRNMRLGRKYFLLLLLPVVVQIVPLLTLLCLYRECQLYPQRSLQDSELADSIGRYALNAFAVLNSLKPSVLRQEPVAPQCSDYLKLLLAESKTLDALWYDFPRRRPELISFWNGPITDLMTKEYQIRQLVLTQTTTPIKHAVETARQANLSIERQKAFNEARRNIFTAREALLILLALQKDNHPVAPEQQLQLRQMCASVALLITVVNIMLVLFTALLFTFDILKRLKTMLDNTERLARDQALNPVVSGTDEITALDQAFHEMAYVIRETTHAHKAMIENAQDLIGSMDAGGRLTTVNPASLPLLGYKQEEIAGRWFMDLIDPEEESNSVRALALMVEGKQDTRFETRAVRKNKAVVDLLISATWSPLEKTAFFVAHDITAKKAAERFQQEVIQMVSHDLRSPLTVISGFHGLLQAGVFGPLEKSGIEQLAIAKRSAKRMLVIINDLLDAEKMQTGMLQLEKSELNLQSILDESIQAASTLSTDKHVPLVAIATSLTVYADRHRLLQIMSNLLTNAIMRSPQQGKVSVWASESGNHVHIFIKDEGQGLPEHLRHSVFERFNQLSGSIAPVEGGSGLGLFICKALVELHGGTIKVDSELNYGNTFSFSIPKVDSPPASATGREVVA